MSGGYRIVTDLFGRAEIETRLALDARKGTADTKPALPHTEDLDIPLDADLTAAFAREIERNREIAARPDTVAAAVGVDTRNWKFTRILLSTNEPNGNENADRLPDPSSGAAPARHASEGRRSMSRRLGVDRHQL